MNRKPLTNVEGEVRELNADDFAHAKPLSAFPDLQAVVTTRKTSGGRPKSDNSKLQVTLRLDADVVAGFKAGGKGWQTRINEALKEYIAQGHSTV